MIKYLVADVGHAYQVGEKKFPCKIKFDDLRGSLKKDAKNCKNLVFVCNQGDEYESNDERARIYFEGLKMSGIKLESVQVLDNRTIKDAKKIIENADFIVLAGGKIECQIEFFNKVNLKKLLSNYNGILFGVSAGAMNMAETVYNYPEEQAEVGIQTFFKGLGLTNISIIPHFNRKTGNDYADRNLNLLKLYRENSKMYNLNLLAIPNGSFVRIDEKENAKIFGEAYEIKGGRIYKLQDATAQLSKF